MGYRGDSKYRELLSLINMYLEEETNVEYEEIGDRIYEAYEDGEIEPTQYDHLINSLG